MSTSEIRVEPKKLTWMGVVLIIAGSVAYAASVNLFLQPLNLYAGGVVGLAQLIRTLLFSHVTNLDVAGIINLMLNVPLFLLAWKSMSKRMVIGTLISVVAQTITFSLVPSPVVPLLDDKLACIVAGGLIGGAGCGLVLTAGGSGGGVDILGVYVTSRKPKASVGLLGICFNATLYTVLAILFDLRTALYSIIFVIVFSLALDKTHYQNIELELMIFTHHPEIKEEIMKKYVRGVTCWKGMGAYTGKETEVLVTVVSKSEVESIKKDIRTLDPQAFIIVHTGTEVSGGYQKRLV